MRDKESLRRWAKEHMVGVENTTIPSFSADLSTLDDEAIRHDVRQAKAHRFYGTLAATEVGLTFDEAKRFVQVVCDEAGSDLFVSTTLLFDSFAENYEMIRHAGSAGVHNFLLGFPSNWRPKTIDELYGAARDMVDACDGAVTLFPSQHFNFARLGESEFPLEVMHRLVADCPNVVAIKIANPGHIVECHRRYGDQILLGNPVEQSLPMMVLGFGMQWMGAGCYEVFQSPEKPYLVDMFRLLRERQVSQAMEIYWKLAPARAMFGQQFGPTARFGSYNWTQQKYYQWCVGGNGGITRQPGLKLHDHEMQATKRAFRAIGVNPPDTDDDFWVGRAETARGARVEPALTST